MAMYAVTATSVCSGIQAFTVPTAVVRRGSSLSMAAEPDRLPAQAKRYYVRPDRILDVLTSAPQILLRLGSGALVDGYQCESDWVLPFLAAFCHVHNSKAMLCLH